LHNRPVLERSLPSNDYLLASEHWSGHSEKDDCKFSKNTGPSLFQDMYLDAFQKDILEAFLTFPNTKPLRNFNKGELFDAAQFPQGTVVRIDREKLLTNRIKTFFKESFKKRYSPTSDLWGVTYNYGHNSMKQAIACYLPAPTIFNPKLMLCVDTIETPIHIGDVYHHKKKHLLGVQNELLRVNKIELYEFGVRIHEKILPEIPILNFQ